MSRNQFWFLTALFLMTPSTFAQMAAKVLKAKGNKAIIQVISGDRLERGDELEIHFAGDSLAISSSGLTLGTRAHSISGELSFSSTSTTIERANVPNSDEQQSAFAIDGKYGWNSGDYEFGPLLTYNGTTVDGENISSLRVGGFLEYNFLSPNRPGVELVPATGLSFELLNATLDSSSGSGYGLTVYLGGKYFMLSDSLAFTGFLTFNQDNISYANDRKDTSQTTGLRFGIAQYF
jgi:hypothetical protein